MLIRHGPTSLFVPVVEKANTCSFAGVKMSDTVEAWYIPPFRAKQRMVCDSPSELGQHMRSVRVSSGTTQRLGW